MSVEAHPRSPLVLAATRAAQVEASRLGIPGVLENEVERSILAGRLNCNRVREGESCFVYLDGFVVEVRRLRTTVSGRLSWQPIAVRRRLYP